MCGSPNEPIPERSRGTDLDLLDVVDDKHVLQVFHGSIHPVVERCRSLGIFQVKLIY